MAGKINMSATSINDNYASTPTKLSSRLAVVNVTLLGVFLQQIAIAERLLTQGTLVLLGAGVYDQVATQVAGTGTDTSHDGGLRAVRHKCLAALRSRPLLPRVGRRGLRKRRTNCRSTCPVGWVSLQVDKSIVISSVHLHTSHLCEILHSIQQVTQAKRKESQQLQALFNILFMLLSYVALSGNFKATT